MKFSLLSLVVTVLQFSYANSFATTGPAVFGVRSATQLFAGKGESDSGGGAAIAKPKIKTNQKVETVTKQQVKSKQKAQVHDPISRRDEEFQDAPMFKLMLLGDDSYDPSHVIERMCAVIEDMDEDQAATVFQQAEMNGAAMCGKYPFERAELFKEQLIRSDPMIFSDLQEENA